ncbi:hypothetical protein [Microbacterium bovistercoris]|nr:hypothetical protein [Microbacterium bovistercoris]
MIWFQTYFSIWEPAPLPASEQIGRYEFAATGALLVVAASLAVALVARRRGLAWLTGIALLFALAAAFVFQIPAGRFVPERVAPTPYNTTGCFGTSGDCPGRLSKKSANVGEGFVTDRVAEYLR